MVISDEEWAALPEEEKERRRQELMAALREALRGYDKETIKAAIEATLKDLKRAKTKPK